MELTAEALELCMALKNATGSYFPFPGKFPQKTITKKMHIDCWESLAKKCIDGNFQDMDRATLTPVVRDHVEEYLGRRRIYRCAASVDPMSLRAWTDAWGKVADVVIKLQEEAIHES